MVEFFWLRVPALQHLRAGARCLVEKLPADVAFRRVPVAFAAPHEPYAKIYLALEAMGQLEALHRKVFAAIHVQRQRLEKDAEIAAFMTSQRRGRDQVHRHLQVASRVPDKFNQAQQLAEAYKIDGVPTIGIHGRFFTSPSLAGSGEQALRVTD